MVLKWLVGIGRSCPQDVVLEKVTHDGGGGLVRGGIGRDHGWFAGQ